MASINPTTLKYQREEITDYVQDLNSWISGIKKEEDKILSKSKNPQEQSPKILSKEERKALQLKEEGNVFYKNEDMKQAIVKYTESIEIYSSNASVHANRAMAYLNLKRYEEARNDCTIALKLDPHYIKAYLRRGAACAKLGILDEALQDYEMVIQLEPKNDEAKKELKALKLMKEEKAVTQSSKSKKGSLFKKKNLKQSISKHTTNIDRDPTNPQHPTERALAYIKLENYKEAHVDCTNALNLDPKYTKAYLHRGMAYSGLGITKDAIQDYKKVLDLDPDNKEAKQELQKLDESISEKCEQAQNKGTSPEKITAVKKPIIHGSLPHHEEEKSEDNNPSKGDSHKRLKMDHKHQDQAEKLKEEGNILYKKGKLKEAVLKYTQSIELDSMNALFPANRAMAYLKLEKYEDARVDCTKALELDPNYIKAYLRRGAACSKLGFLAEAALDYEKVLHLEPWNKIAKSELDAIKILIASNKINSKNEVKAEEHMEEKGPVGKIPEKGNTEENPSKKVEEIVSETTLHEQHSSDEPEISKQDSSDQFFLRDSVIYEQPKPSTLSLQRSEKLKEEGNSFFKNGNIKQAIAKYTQSMALNPSNAQLPSNRALAYIKLEKYEAALSDCTKAIKLDPNYLKAYLRRAKSSAKLNKFSNAICDYEKVLELEPWNKEAQEELQTIKKDFSEEKKKISDTEEDKAEESLHIHQEKRNEKRIGDASIKSEGILVNPIQKPLHLRSKSPLTHINIRDVLREEDIRVGMKVNSSPTPSTIENSDKTDRLKPEEVSKSEDNSETQIENPAETSLEEVPPLPRNSNNFYQSWNKIHHSTSLLAKYLMSIPPVFLRGAEIEVDHFIEIIHVLNSDYLDAGIATDYLLALTKSPTYNLNVAFLDTDQKKDFTLLLNKVESDDNIKEIITSLRSDLS